MGMYDYVNFKMNCPRCKKDMGEFQTKDGICLMVELDFFEVRNFYASCENCSTWVEFTLKKRPNRELTIKDYEKRVEKTTKKDDVKHKKMMDELRDMFSKGGEKK